MRTIADKKQTCRRVWSGRFKMNHECVRQEILHKNVMDLSARLAVKSNLMISGNFCHIVYIDDVLLYVRAGKCLNK